MEEITTRQCPGCKIILPKQEELDYLYDGAFGRYGVASPECLNLLNKVLLQEYEYGRPMSLRIDAYGVQHPPHGEIQKALGIKPRLIAASKQSVAIHLLALYFMLEKKLPLSEVAVSMDRILSSGVKLEDYELVPPRNVGAITVADVAQAQSREEHIHLVGQWNRVAWTAWVAYHPTVRSWYEKYGK